MGTKHYGATFNRALRKLHAKYPLPIRLRIVPAGSLPRDDDEEVVHGHSVAYYCQDTNKVRYVVVKIERGQDETVATDTLIHEWGHAVDALKNGRSDRKPHRDSMGVHWVRCYRAVNE
jgi:hypothetical protein